MIAIIQRIIAFFMSVLAFFGLGPKPAPQEINIPDINSGEVIETENGSVRLDGGDLIIELRGNPTTGYEWTHTEEGDALQFNGDWYIQDTAEPNMGGTGGTFVFVYALDEPGETKITFTYARSWETGSEPADTVMIDVTVSEALDIKSFSYIHA